MISIVWQRCKRNLLRTGCRAAGHACSADDALFLRIDLHNPRIAGTLLLEAFALETQRHADPADQNQHVDQGVGHAGNGRFRSQPEHRDGGMKIVAGRGERRRWWFWDSRSRTAA